MTITVPSIASRAIRPRRRTAAAQEEPVTTTQERQAVSAAKLISFINSEAQAHPACAGVKVRSGAWDLDPHADDCNWSPTSLVVQVNGTVSAAAFEELRRVIARAQARFDVVAPEAYLL